MPEPGMEMPGPDRQMPPMSPEEIEKAAKYRMGVRISMKDGTVRTVYSLAEEIKARQEDGEKGYNA